MLPQFLSFRKSNIRQGQETYFFEELPSSTMIPPIEPMEELVFRDPIHQINPPIASTSEQIKSVEEILCCDCEKGQVCHLCIKEQTPMCGVYPDFNVGYTITNGQVTFTCDDCGNIVPPF
jgi:hypothetical protein